MKYYILLAIIIVIVCIIIYNNYFNNELKLDCVLTACNTNPLYMECIPIFIKSWGILYPNVDVKIILISDSIPNELNEYKNNIILFKPINDISTAFISQYIRLLYPCLLNYNGGVLITDVDDIPMNNTYFVNNLKNISNSNFLYYRDWVENDEIAICWQIATPKIWSEVFNIYTLDDIINRLQDVYSENEYIDGHGNLGWSTDQKELFKYIKSWNNKTNNFISLKDKHTGYNRLDRVNQCNMTHDIKLNIIEGKYSDYHICRPYSKHKEFNDEILELLKKIK